MLSGFSDQSIAVGCYCIVKVHSNYANFTMFLEFVLRGPDDGGDFEVRSCPQSTFLVSCGLITIYLSRDTGTRVHDGGTAPRAF